MRSPMDEQTYLNFYRNTVLGCSKATYNHICNELIRERRIVIDGQRSIDDYLQDGQPVVSDRADTLHFDKKDAERIVTETALDSHFSGFYEGWEFSKLYKYSVPLFYQLPEGSKELLHVLESKGIKKLDKDKFTPDRVLNTSLKDSEPLMWQCGEGLFVKFVLQKYYYNLEPFEQVDYRYPVVLFFNPECSVVEIRYDSVRYSRDEMSSDMSYEALVKDCIDWMKRELGLKLFRCEHNNFIQTINDPSNADVRIYRQMMQLSSGGSADLTASEGADYMLPFIGEIRELMEENDALFREAEDIRKLLNKYLNDKVDTASYSYVYVKWVKPVESQSYMVRVTFDYLNRKYTLLQHITGICKDLGMRQMNDAIQYLCQHGSFIKGEEA